LGWEVLSRHQFIDTAQAQAMVLEWCYDFYNQTHRHSGIAWHTPDSVHFGTAEAIDQDRHNSLTAAYHAHPERFGHRPHPPAMPTQFWINQPEIQPQMN